MTAQELIKRSLRIIGVVAPGETPGDDEMQDSLSALNTMLNLWSSKSLAVPVLTTESFSLVVGTNSYTIGSGSTWNTVRPLRITNAYIRASNLDYSIKMLSRERYNDITDKNIRGRPEYLWYDNQYPEATVYLYYTPNATDTIFIDSWKPLSSIAALTTSVSFPEGYEEALIFNLAKRMAPEYGTSLSPEAKDLARDSFKTIRNFNYKEPNTRLDLPGGIPSGNRNIESGGF